jgi:hypothetical protein
MLPPDPGSTASAVGVLVEEDSIVVTVPPPIGAVAIWPGEVVEPFPKLTQ